MLHLLAQHVRASLLALLSHRKSSVPSLFERMEITSASHLSVEESLSNSSQMERMEERPQVLDQQFWYFKGCEMTTTGHLGPACDTQEAFAQFARRIGQIFGEENNPCWNFDIDPEETSAYSSTQFQKRLERIKKARGQTLDEINNEVESVEYA